MKKEEELSCVMWSHNNTDGKVLAATLKYLRFTDFIRGKWNIVSCVIILTIEGLGEDI